MLDPLVSTHPTHRHGGSFLFILPSRCTIPKVRKSNSDGARKPDCIRAIRGGAEATGYFGVELKPAGKVRRDAKGGVSA